MMSQEQWINIGLYGAFILIALATVAAIGMNIANSVSNPKTLIKGAAGVGILAVIFIIGYSMAPAEFGASTARALEASKIDPATAGSLYKFVGGAMTTTLVLVIVALGGLIYSSVARILR